MMGMGLVPMKCHRTLEQNGSEKGETGNAAKHGAGRMKCYNNQQRTYSIYLYLAYVRTVRSW